MSVEPGARKQKPSTIAAFNPPAISRWRLYIARLAEYAPLLLIGGLALGLRLLVWRWHELYPLGGDESEYFGQALTLLREHRYVELKLMRPPLYTAFLAACIYLFDSLVQRLRLAQALISTLTIVPVYLLTFQIFGRRKVALVAALLAAASYTLAANAAELLTETLFLFGLTTLFWLLVKALSSHALTRVRLAALAGLVLGALVLLRSVALPLLPLGALCLLARRPTTDRPARFTFLGRVPSGWFLVLGSRSGTLWVVLCSLFFVLCTLLFIAPWTIRNYATYGAPILVDTTGAENLWLDNDPAGRDAVKAQLYALGEDRAERQRIALNRGLAAITSDPGRFLRKAGGEAQKFLALEYFDDMRERRAIWVPPLEVWLRLLLGDGLWLVLLLAGVAGLWLAPATDDKVTRRQGDKVTESEEAITVSPLHPVTDDKVTRRQGDKVTESEEAITVSPLHPVTVSGQPVVVDARWLLVPWALYTLLTAVVFHVELRYRLPLYPALSPYAAWTLVHITGRLVPNSLTRSPVHPLTRSRIGAVLTCLLLVGLTLLHRPYIGEAWMLAWKHFRLGQAERALAGGDLAGAREAAREALRWDPDSALARVVQARAALGAGDLAGASAAIEQARAALPDHPYARLLRGALLRQQGDSAAAQAELAHEIDSLEDMQRWAWQAFAPIAPPASQVEVGGGLDLGYVRGFSARQDGDFRWTGAESEMRLAVSEDAAAIEVRIASGRPDSATRPQVIFLLDGRELGRIAPGPGWQIYRLPLPADRAPGAGAHVLTIRADTFRPRDFDRASPDNQARGVMVARVAVVP